MGINTILQRLHTTLENTASDRYLFRLLVANEIQKKYRNSVLGILWSLLEPLLDMIVLTIVFSNLLNKSIEYFPVYLLSGRLLFGFFASATKSGMTCIVTKAALIRKVYISKYMIFFSRLSAAFIIFLISLIDLAVLMIVSGAPITIYSLYSIFYLLLLFIFTSGIGLILATLHVFFRDIEHLYSVFITALMYATCIFYHPSIIPDQYHFILDINPMYHFVSGFRNVLYYGNNIELSNICICFCFAFCALLLGCFIFSKNQKKFIMKV